MQDSPTQSDGVFDAQKERVFYGIQLGLTDSDEEVRHLAANSLNPFALTVNRATRITMGVDGVSPYDDFAHDIASLAVQLLTDHNDKVVIAAAKALSALDKNYPETIPDLVTALEHTEPRVRLNAASVLADMGVEADKAVPVLIDYLANSDSNLGWFEARQAPDALGKYGLEATDAIPVLLERMKTDNILYTPNAAIAVVAIGEPFDLILSTLMEYLDLDNTYAQKSAAYCLGQFGARAEPALRRLMVIAQSNLHVSRDKAGEAVQLIEAALAASESDEIDLSTVESEQLVP